MSFEKLLDEKARFIPDRGFNVVGVDSFEESDLKLYLIGHFETRAEAERAREAYAASTWDSVYVYGPADA